MPPLLAVHKRVPSSVFPRPRVTFPTVSIPVPVLTMFMYEYVGEELGPDGVEPRSDGHAPYPIIDEAFKASVPYEKHIYSPNFFLISASLASAPLHK